MNSGYYDRGITKAAYAQREQEYIILRKGTPEEQTELRKLWLEASQLAGRDWCEYSNQETTDEGIEKSASLLVKYRLLLADIRHRKSS